MEVIIQLINGGSIRIMCTDSQFQSLTNNAGIQTDMYGFINAAQISSWRKV